MSPKSRGRVTKHHKNGPTRPRTDNPVRRVVGDAAQLLGGSRLEAEQWASTALGRVWARAGLGLREPEVSMVRLMMGVAKERPSEVATAALAACRLLISLDELDDVLSDVVLPEWAAKPLPVPVRAWHAQDPWDNQQVWVLEYDDHALVASLSHVGGTVITTMGIAPLDRLSVIDAGAEASDRVLPRREVPVTEACGELRDALDVLDRYWPRADDEKVVATRLLARARVTPYAPATVEWVYPFSVEEDERLRAGFLAGREDESAQYLSGVFRDFGAGYLRQPLLWGPEAVEYFLLSYVPRKVALDAADRAALPSLLKEWLTFSLTEHGLEDRWHGPVLAAVDDAVDEYFEQFQPGAGGPADDVARFLVQSGIDLQDKDAVQQQMQIFNAGALARLMREEGDASD